MTTWMGYEHRKPVTMAARLDAGRELVRVVS